MSGRAARAWIGGVIATSTVGCLLTDDLDDLTSGRSAAGGTTTAAAGSGGEATMGGTSPTAGSTGAMAGSPPMAGAAGTPAVGGTSSMGGAGGTANAGTGGGEQEPSDSAVATQVYWTEAGTRRVNVANVNGSGLTTVLTLQGAVSEPSRLAISRAAPTKLFLVDRGRARIQTANSDGSGLNTIAQSVMAPADVVVASTTQRVYLADGGSTPGIYSASFDGTNLQPVLTTPLQNPVALAIDFGTSRMYVADDALPTIYSANLDGSELVDLAIQGLGTPVDIAVDPEGGELYWSEAAPSAKVRRCATDGTSVEDLITSANLAGFASPAGIEVDVAARLLYFVKGGMGGAIYSSALDGTDIHPLLNPLDQPLGLALGYE